MEDVLLGLASQALMKVLIWSAPAVLAGLLVGFMISLFQAVTQIQEQTLTFVPKILAILGALVFLGYYMMNHLVDYTLNLFAIIPDLVK